MGGRGTERGQMERLRTVTERGRLQRKRELLSLERFVFIVYEKQWLEWQEYVIPATFRVCSQALEQTCSMNENFKCNLKTHFFSLAIKGLLRLSGFCQASADLSFLLPTPFLSHC